MFILSFIPTKLTWNQIRSFKKCGISVNPDDSEDEVINIAGLPNYRGPTVTRENTLATVVDTTRATERLFDSDDSDLSDSNSISDMD